MKIRKIRINTSQKNYSIYFGNNFIQNLSKYTIKENIFFKKCLIVIDSKVSKKFLYTIKNSLKKKKLYYLIFNASENNKNMSTIKNILNLLLKNNFSRNDCIISLGGGITGDTTCFAASIFKRGIKFINIPTTLLAQVDASIGGKSGVNDKKFGKNQIGTFYQPDLVMSDTSFLKSLSKKEIICGYAEILKHSLIYSVNNFNYLNKYYKEIFNLKNPYILDAIYQSCNIKKKIVEKDENEKELRKILNLGHTFGHAYEAASGFGKKINHGEGVILGIKSAIKFSLNKSYIKNKNYKKILDHINKLDFNLKLKNIFNKSNIPSLIKFMMYDKKNSSDKINLILLKDIGKPILNRKFDIKELKKFFNKELVNL